MQCQAVASISLHVRQWVISVLTGSVHTPEHTSRKEVNQQSARSQQSAYGHHRRKDCHPRRESCRWSVWDCDSFITYTCLPLLPCTSRPPCFQSSPLLSTDRQSSCCQSPDIVETVAYRDSYVCQKYRKAEDLPGCHDLPLFGSARGFLRNCREIRQL